jgi:retron-type reverse transcriptase
MSNLLHDISSLFDLSRDDLVYLIRSAPYRYKVYDIPKREPGKTRTIAQPAREVKPLQYWVMENILSRFPVHPAATAYRKGRNIADNAQPHARHRYICKMDFRNFFPSIKSIDFERFISESKYARDWSEEEIDYLSRILFWRKKRGRDLRLSIGAPSSPLLSNILLYRFDIEVSELCLSRRVAYTRYADDLTFSTNEQGVLFQIEREIPKICTRLKSPRLILNKSKTVHASKKGARRVTGLVLSNDGTVSIGRDKKRLTRAGIHRFVSGRLDDEEAAELAGMVAYIKSVEPAFLYRLSKKYGAEVISRLFSCNRSVKS